jgi:chitinase
LIELIKKAGGIEELEKQINAQEEGTANKNGQKVASPTTSTIDKSLVDKIRNRASLFKSRPPIVNGASQPEQLSKKAIAEIFEKAKIQEATTENAAPKKYNSINRFSRPQAQNAGVKDIPESDAILIEKPQYTSILRRKPVKPDVIAENDYNNESDKSTSIETDERAVDNKKYTSISRPRRPQVEVVEEDDEDEEEIDDEIETEKPVPTTKAPSKYINLSRRRQTTPEPADEK